MRIDKNIWIMIGLGSIIFHMYLTFSGLIPNLVSRPIHMAVAIPWIFLYSENDKKEIEYSLFFLFDSPKTQLYIFLKRFKF